MTTRIASSVPWWIDEAFFVVAFFPILFSYHELASAAANLHSQGDSAMSEDPEQSSSPLQYRPRNLEVERRKPGGRTRTGNQRRRGGPDRSPDPTCPWQRLPDCHRDRRWKHSSRRPVFRCQRAGPGSDGALHGDARDDHQFARDAGRLGITGAANARHVGDSR